MDLPVLSDGVVVLRSHREDDVTRVVEQARDPETVRWTSVPQPYDHDDGRSFVTDLVRRSWTDGTAAYFAIQTAETAETAETAGCFAGTIDLRFAGDGTAEVGFGLHPDARGRGVVRRALDLVLDWGFAERDLAVVTWRAHEGNWASRRVAWATGFTFGPTVAGLLVQRGERRDAWVGWLGRDDAREPVTPWLEPVPLDGDRVHLRPWRVDDGARLVEAVLDPVLRTEIRRSPLPTTLDGVHDYLASAELRAATGERVGWCVADAASDLALGNVALFDLADGQAEVGYWAHPEGRGRGAMTEALRLVVRHAVDALDLRRLSLRAAVTNTASRRLAERAGFVHVGTERACLPASGGGWDDAAVHDVLLG